MELNKKLGIILIILAILLGATLIIMKVTLDANNVELMKASGGSCFVDDVCIHDQANEFQIPFYFALAFDILILAMGIALVVIEPKEKVIQESHDKITKALKASKTEQSKKEKLDILLSALDEDEKKVILAVKEQDGISQPTLKLRTDLSKTKLSVLLTGLEKKGLIKKDLKGKINYIYLKKAL